MRPFVPWLFTIAGIFAGVALWISTKFHGIRTPLTRLTHLIAVVAFGMGSGAAFADGNRWLASVDVLLFCFTMAYITTVLRPGGR